MHTKKWIAIILILTALLSASGTTLGIIPIFGALIDTVLGVVGGYLLVHRGRG